VLIETGHPTVRCRPAAAETAAMSADIHSRQKYDDAVTSHVAADAARERDDDDADDNDDICRRSSRLGA